MKNLTKTYKKTKLQKTNCEISFFRNKIEIHISYNKIGFYREFYNPERGHFINNFYRYTHHVNYGKNHKLYKKYPHNVTKKEYKEWLKTI